MTQLTTRLPATVFVGLLLLAACSETPIEERGEEAIAELEQQIETDAQSLEAAADDAVKALAEDIDDELAADGIADPAISNGAEDDGN